MKFTDAQQAAIDIRGKTLLVSAAAGSGKTFTLTQRILKSIIEDKRDISRMLIVTFTRAAASELKSKISKTISEAIAEHPDNQHLQNQLLKLGNANICTIDSFFTSPVRTNFEKLGLPASIRLADDAELTPLRREAMRQAINSFISAHDQKDRTDLDSASDNPISELMSIISPARDSSGVIPTFIDTYQRLSTSPEGIERLKNHADRMLSSAEIDFFESREGEIIWQEAVSRVKYAITTLEKALLDFENYSDVGAYYSGCFQNDLLRCNELIKILEEKNYAKAKEAFEGFTVPKIPSVSSKVKTENFTYYQNLRSKKIMPVIKDIPASLLYEDPQVISEYFKETARLCLATYELLSDFETRYNAEKLKKGFCEFADMPKYMLRLLTNEDGTPSEYCHSLRESFDEVYIDEYQDVNEIQDRIFSLIGDKHRFMVGDIKQSIYGFREAEPSIFADYRNRFKLYDGKDEESKKAAENTIFMSDNFRCDENVIKFTNIVCSRVFSAFADSIGYTPNDDLVFSKEKPYEEYKSPLVEINIIDPSDPTILENRVDEAIDEQASSSGESEKTIKSQKNLSDEACVTANEIMRLIKHEKKANGAPIRAGDIAVLVRSHNHAKPLMLALDMLGIRYTSSSGSGIFTDPDMLLLIDLMTVINNPRSDIPLCRLITTEHGGIDPVLNFEETVEIRKCAPVSSSLFDAMIFYADKGENEQTAAKCRDFISEIDSLRRLSVRLSADKLLRVIAVTGRYATLAQSDSYVYLLDCACQYVRRSWNGLASFLSYLKRLSQSTASSSEKPGADPDAVSIMTMHQSKGLEFCACFLFGLGKMINLSDSKNPMIYSKELGLSFKLPPPVAEIDRFEKVRVRYGSTPLWKAADLIVKNKQIEEEARILYVALTRARERLYLSATLRRSYEALISDVQGCADLPYAIRKSKSYIETVMLTLAQISWDNDIFHGRVTYKGEADLTYSRMSFRSTELQSSESADEIEFADLYSEGSEYDETEKLLSSLPSKVAASKVSPTMLEDSIFLPIPAGQLFDDGDEDIRDQSREDKAGIKNRIALMRSQNIDFDSLLEVNKKPTASEKGTATHQFLQFCDYEKIDEFGVEAEIARLKDARFISERTARIIDRNQLKGFFESELYSGIRSAHKVHREFRFRMFRPASDFTEDQNLKALVSEKKIFVQGSIDLIIEDRDGNLILCDYKTDRVSADEKNDRELLIKKMREKHGEQLKQYEYAIKRIFGRAPKKIYIYLLSIGSAIEII